MALDPGIDENTSQPSFRVSAGSYNTSRVAAVYGPVTKLAGVNPGPSGGRASGVVLVGVAAPQAPDLGRVRRN